MTLKERERITKEIFDECMKVGRAKGQDYAGKEDTLHNFKGIADDLGLTKYQVWAVYCSKQIYSIMNSIKLDPNNPQVESEPLRERIKDVIVYMVILQALMEEKDE